MVDQAIVKFNSSFKLWVIKSHLLEHFENFEAVRNNYEEALQVVELRKDHRLWICAANFESDQNMFTKARTLL
jgi:hypothetical protein